MKRIILNMTSQPGKIAHPLLLFLHLPKCGGISLRSIVAAQYDEAERRFIYNNELNSIIPNQDCVQEFERHRDKIKIIYGHMPFGAHRILNMPPFYATVMRDPVERVISYYYFAKNNKKMDDESRQHALNLSLKAFVESDITRQSNNYVTRLIAGLPYRFLYLLPNENTLLDIAKNNIEKYFFFTGLLETLNDDLEILAGQLGWRPCKLPRRNMRKNTGSEEVDAETRELITERNKLDIALYKWVKERPERLNTGILEDLVMRY